MTRTRHLALAILLLCLVIYTYVFKEGYTLVVRK